MKENVCNVKPQQQDLWERDEQALLVVEYFRTKNLGEEEIKKSNKLVSKILRERAKLRGKVLNDTYRNEWGITRQRMNMEKYDPDNGYVLKEEETRWMPRIIKEYKEDANIFKAEAYDLVIEVIKKGDFL